MGKKNKIRSLAALLLAAVCAFSCAVPAFAASDGMYEYEVQSGGAVITAYLGGGSAVVNIPATLGGYPVTGIGAMAFGEVEDGVKPHAEIQQIIFPATVTEFGDRAFAGTGWFDNSASADSEGFLTVNGVLLRYMGSDAVVVVPDSVKSIAIGAFEKNTGITDVTLPAGVTRIPDYAFYKCTSLQQVTVLGELLRIGQSAFYGCSALRGLGGADGIFPQTLRSVGKNAFYRCTSLSGEIDFGSDLLTLETYAFADCPALTGVIVPDTLESIGSYAIGFSLEYRSGVYYPIQNDNFIIHVSHAQAQTPEEEQLALTTYNKTNMPIYRYANDPDGTGYFDAFALDWARLAYPFQLGDVNNDGSVSTADARLVLRCAVSLEEISHESDRKAADWNEDGDIRTADARMILRYAIGLPT